MAWELVNCNPDLDFAQTCSDHVMEKQSPSHINFVPNLCLYRLTTLAWNMKSQDHRQLALQRA